MHELTLEESKQVNITAFHYANSFVRCIYETSKGYTEVKAIHTILESLREMGIVEEVIKAICALIDRCSTMPVNPYTADDAILNQFVTEFLEDVQVLIPDQPS